jgi:hypothetical protein
MRITKPNEHCHIIHLNHSYTLAFPETIKSIELYSTNKDDNDTSYLFFVSLSKLLLEKKTSTQHSKTKEWEFIQKNAS